MIRWLALFLFILYPVQILRAAQFSIAPFTADVTVPIGHGMMGARVLIEDSETHAAWIRANSAPTMAANTVPERTTGEDR